MFLNVPCLTVVV